MQIVLQFSQLRGVVLGHDVQGFTTGCLRKPGSSAGCSFSSGGDVVPRPACGAVRPSWKRGEQKDDEEDKQDRNHDQLVDFSGRSGQRGDVVTVPRDARGRSFDAGCCGSIPTHRSLAKAFQAAEGRRVSMSGLCERSSGGDYSVSPPRSPTILNRLVSETTYSIIPM